MPLASAPTPEAVAAPATAPVVPQREAVRAEPAVTPSAPESSVVQPLPSPKDVPAYADPQRPAPVGLQPETDIAKIQPDVIPSFPGSASAPAGSDPVLNAVNEWGAAWARRDQPAYFAAYDERFVPQDGSRADWERRKRQALDAAKSIELRIDSPRVSRTEEGTVAVTFNQFYRSDRYRDAVVKQLHLVERDGRWLIVEERVLSVLQGAQP
jgi:outer membrane protein assembly factor BamE